MTADNAKNRVHSQIGAHLAYGGISVPYWHTGAINTEQLQTLAGIVELSGATVMTFPEAVDWVLSKTEASVTDNDSDVLTADAFTSIDYNDVNLYPLSSSILIDSGTGVGLSSDYAGNSIYGIPDIGAYEYQPPYTIGTTDIPTTGEIRIYTDGKYRMRTASSTSATTSFSITPVSGNYQATTTQYMDITIDTWETTGDQNKQWTATSTTGSFLTHATSTIYTVGDLVADTYYNFNLDGTASTTAITGTTCTGGVCLSDSSGQVIFTYSGGYSTHVFALNKDTTSPASFNLSTADNTSTAGTDSALTWSASSDSSAGISKYQLYIDGSLDTDNISSSATSVTPTNSLSCGSHTWYVRAVDNNGNTTNSSSRTITKVCDTGMIFTGYIPNIPTSRLQTVNPDGTIEYLEEETLDRDADAREDESLDSSFAQRHEDEVLRSKTSSDDSGAVVSASSSVAVQVFNQNLWKGLKNNDTINLQQLLRELNIFTYPTNTGYYGTVTETAVKQFQCEQNIVCEGTPYSTGYGVVGPKTREALNKANSLQPTADSKEEQQVTQLQQQISDLLKMVEELQKQLLRI